MFHHVVVERPREDSPLLSGYLFGFISNFAGFVLARHVLVLLLLLTKCRRGYCEASSPRKGGWLVVVICAVQLLGGISVLCGAREFPVRQQSVPRGLRQW